MKRFLSLAAVALLAASLAGQAAEAGKPSAARSVHLWWQPAPEGEVFYNEVTVEASVNGSYFMACGFSHGYFGIQQLGNPTNKVALFSIWDPGDQNNPDGVPADRRVEEVAHGEGVRIRRFGGEGTGGQSMTPFPWKIGETVRFVVAAKTNGNKTTFTAWIYRNDQQAWQLMASFRTLTGGKPLGGYYSFIEDFRRDGKSPDETRRARFGNGWVKSVTGDWVPLDEARFTADRTPLDNIDAGVVSNRFFLITGGPITNQTKLRSSIKLSPSAHQPPTDLPKDLAPGAKSQVSASRSTQHPAAFSRLCAAEPAAVAPQALEDQAIFNRLEREGARLVEQGKTGGNLCSQLRRANCTLQLAPPRDHKLSPSQIAQAAERSVAVLGDLYRCERCGKLHWGTAGGFFLNDAGALATCYHVVARTNTTGLVAMTREGRLFPVRGVLACNRAADLAIVQVDGSGFTPLPLCTNAAIGSAVLVLSHPDAHFYSLTSGIVSRYYSTGRRRATPWMAITAGFAKGSSGSPVLDECGNAVGIVNNTESIYYDARRNRQEDLQMVLNNCAPAEALLALATAQ